MKLIKGDNYNVYIYPEDHAPPHCHIRYKDNGPESVVGIPLLNLLVGRKITGAITQTLRENLTMLAETWDKLNPTDNK